MIADATRTDLSEESWLESYELAFAEHWRHSPGTLEGMRRRRAITRHTA